MVPETRLSISVDTALVYKLQAVLQLKHNKRVPVAEVIRLALQKLAEIELKS